MTKSLSDALYLPKTAQGCAALYRCTGLSQQVLWDRVRACVPNADTDCLAPCIPSLNALDQRPTFA